MEPLLRLKKTLDLIHDQLLNIYLIILNKTLLLGYSTVSRTYTKKLKPDNKGKRKIYDALLDSVEKLATMIKFTNNSNIAIIGGAYILYIGEHFFHIDDFISAFIDMHKLDQQIYLLP